MLTNAFAIMQIVQTAWREQKEIGISGKSVDLKFLRRLVTSNLLVLRPKKVVLFPEIGRVKHCKHNAYIHM